MDHPRPKLQAVKPGNSASRFKVGHFAEAVPHDNPCPSIQLLGQYQQSDLQFDFMGFQKTQESLPPVRVSGSILNRE